MVEFSTPISDAKRDLLALCADTGFDNPNRIHFTLFKSSGSLYAQRGLGENARDWGLSNLQKEAIYELVQKDGLLVPTDGKDLADPDAMVRLEPTFLLHWVLCPGAEYHVMRFGANGEPDQIVSIDQSLPAVKLVREGSITLYPHERIQADDGDILMLIIVSQRDRAMLERRKNNDELAVRRGELRFRRKGRVAAPAG